MSDDESFHPPNEELEQRARLFAQRARQLLEELKDTAGDITFQSVTALHYFLQSQSCYAEVARRDDIARAERDRKRNEEIAERDHKLEKWVLCLIGIEILLSVIGLIAGYQQGRVLDRQTTALQHMDSSTVKTSESLQKLVTSQDAALRILQQQEAERARKPKLALYLGNTPIERASVRLATVQGAAQARAYVDLLLKNEGDSPVSTFRLYAIVPEDVMLDVERLITVPESEPPAHPHTHRVTLQLHELPAGETVGIRIGILASKQHLTVFKIPFTVDALELQAVAPLGSLTVLPPKT